MLAEVVGKLRVSHVLEGSVRRAGNRLRITVQLIDVATDHHLWSERYDRTMDDVFAVQDEIATTVAERMRASLGPAAGRRVQHAPSDVRAYELYLKGRGYLYQRGLGLVKGLQNMQEALELEPDYPAALAGLADANTLLALFGAGPPGPYRRTALTAAQRAVSLAPDLAEAHNAVAGVEMMLEWNRPMAEASFRRALELNPQYLQARAWYALFYLGLSGGRFEEAIEQSARCVESDPLSGYAHAVRAFSLAFGGRASQAMPFLDEARSLRADAFLVHLTGQMCHYVAGEWDESIAAAETALAVSGRHPWSLANLCVSLVAAGRDTEARAIQGELTSRAGVSYVQPFALAQTAAAVGDADAAFAYAEQAFEEHDPAMLVFGPYWKATHHLRSDPRFVDLLRRAGFPGWEAEEA